MFLWYLLNILYIHVAFGVLWGVKVCDWPELRPCPELIFIFQLFFDMEALVLFSTVATTLPHRTSQINAQYIYVM
jgi:hypothetical protein